MNRKKYIIAGTTIIVFIIIIIIILLNKNSKENWITEILNSEKYEITMKNCNNQEKKLPNEVLQELSNNWNKVSNNGPWLGNNNTCYNTVTINFETNNIIQKTEILLIDDTSLVLNINNSSTYYTNSSNINNYINSIFNIN